MIELTNLTKRYGRNLAVDHLNLTVEKGELFGFIGPNGAGKTTTLRMMAGILGATEGTIAIAGIDVAQYPEKAKKIIGFIPDRPFLYEKLTGREFMGFIGDLYGVAEEDFPERVNELLQNFSLYDWGDHLIEAYSHGMKQRLIIASALLHKPEIIIVDEPMVGLDPAGIRVVKNIFRGLAANGVTIFMSTHTLEIAEDLCDRIGIIHQGRMIALGTTGDLRGTARLNEGDLEEVFLRLTQKSEGEGAS
ncbi:MAG: ABC transporter ATP-binding protein [Syntrophales bacterium]|jgi:ABC-2 type transport system ATP-binding protein|nr:ABC transporter ATP-binding protein [Syntrophales bacterium]